MQIVGVNGRGITAPKGVTREKDRQRAAAVELLNFVDYIFERNSVAVIIVDSMKAGGTARRFVGLG